MHRLNFLEEVWVAHGGLIKAKPYLKVHGTEQLGVEVGNCMQNHEYIILMKILHILTF